MIKKIIYKIYKKPDLKSEKIISNKYRFIYFSIPKVATRSILNALHRDQKFNMETCEYGVKSEDILKIKDYENYFKFSFVRNPWSRVVSCYLDKIKNPSKNSFKAIISRYDIKPNISFKDFVYFLINNRDGGDKRGDRHWISQHLFISDKNNKLFVDFCGKFENLDKDFLMVCEKMGIDKMVLPKLNTRFGWNPGEKYKKDFYYYRDFYDNETRNMINDRYKKDINIFNYKF